MEAAAFGIRAIALSYAFFSREHHWETVDGAGKVALNVMGWLCGDGKSKGGWGKDVEVYSINVPLVEGVEGRQVWMTPMLENRWKNGSAFTEVTEEEEESIPEMREEAKAEAREKEIREQQDGPGEDVEKRGGIEGSKGKGKRSFKWSPRFADVHRSVDESEPGNDGWAIRQGYTR